MSLCFDHTYHITTILALHLQQQAPTPRLHNHTRPMPTHGHMHPHHRSFISILAQAHAALWTVSWAKAHLAMDSMDACILAQAHAAMDSILS
eukprot:600137-Pelagomonas_calceolata.AAC.5